MQRSVKKPKLNRFDRLLWAWFCGVWDEWRSALCIVKPETVIAWHRKGFRLFWTWKVRRGQPGRRPVLKEIRKLIRKMSRENPIWGAHRIHGELLKLGIDIGETSASKYMVRRRNPAFADMAYLSGEPREDHGVHRFLHGTDHSISGAVRVPGAGS
jgi:hypothetical protein